MYSAFVDFLKNPTMASAIAIIVALACVVGYLFMTTTFANAAEVRRAFEGVNVRFLETEQHVHEQVRALRVGMLADVVARDLRRTRLQVRLGTCGDCRVQKALVAEYQDELRRLPQKSLYDNGLENADDYVEDGQ